MESSKPSSAIYGLRGWRTDAIVLMKVIPAIYHSGTASQSGGIFIGVLGDRSSRRVGKPGGKGG